MNCPKITLTSGPISINASVTITGTSLFTTISGGNSSAVFDVVSGTTKMSQLRIENGNASQGGGIENNGNLTLNDVVVDHNTGSYIGGGIINNGTLTVAYSRIIDNTSGEGGGAIMNYNGSLSVTNSTLSGNTGQYGGGIQNLNTATIADSTLSDNVAGASGGGIYNQGGTLTLTNSTVAGNNADSSSGGGVFVNNGTVNVSNSTLAGNSATDGVSGGTDNVSGTLSIAATIVADNTGGDCKGTVADYGYNLDSDGSCGLTRANGDVPDTDPNLDPAGLQNNGQTTETIGLQTGSAAIDAVTNASLCPPSDQRGYERTVPCDIGSYDTDAHQTITITTTPPAVYVGGPAYNVMAVSDAGLPVGFEVVGTESVCSVSPALYGGGDVFFFSPGTCNIEAVNSGDSTYPPANAEQSFNVRASQTITFSSSAPTHATVGTTYTVAANASSGDSVAFSVDPGSSSVCSVAGSIVSFIQTGQCVVDASQSGNAAYGPIQNFQSFAVYGDPQTVTFDSTPPAQGIVGGPTYTVSATASSGLPVHFVIYNPPQTVCYLTGDVVTFFGPGNCAINAIQDGNRTFASAVTVQTINVFASQTINFTSTRPVEGIVRGPSYVVKATGGRSGNPVTFSSANPVACRVSGATVSFVGAGTCVIKADQAGNGSYLPASEVSQSFPVINVQAFTNPRSTSAAIRSPFTFSVRTSGLPVPSLQETGTLPSGVHFVDNHNGSGTLYGVPGKRGTYRVVFTATFGAGKGKVVTQAFTLTVT